MRGLAIGPARWSRPPELDLDALESGTPEEEARGLEAALAAARERLAETAARLPDSEAEIFAAQALLLDDASIIDPARAAIAAGEPAGRAFQRASEAVAEDLDGLDDPYLRARAVDVRDVAQRVLAALAGAAPAGAPAEPGIVVAEELTPSAVAHLDPERAWGIATARGGTLDHAAIVAGALGIPYVIGLGAALETVAEGSTLAVDGDAGLVEVEPDAASAAAFEQRREAAAELRARALERAFEPVVLPDGRRVEVFANIGSVADADLAVAQGAEGVGLLRTEFLYLERAEPPSEDEQAAVLTEIARRLGGRPLIVRTLDAGADKPLPFIATDPRGESVPRTPRTAPLARAPGPLLGAAARDPARGGRAPRLRDVPDGHHPRRGRGGAPAARRRARSGRGDGADRGRGDDRGAGGRAAGR